MNEKPIHQLRNLGPACERDLNAVGIYTLADIKKHGVEATFLQMMQGRRQKAKKQNKKGGTCFNAAYLYAPLRSPSTTSTGAKFPNPRKNSSKS